MNKCLLTGRVATETAFSRTDSGSLTTTFLLAVPRPRSSGNQPDADFIWIRSWGPCAEFAFTYLSVGRLVEVEAHLASWQQRTEAGGSQTRLEVVAHRIQPLDRNPSPLTDAEPVYENHKSSERSWEEQLG